MPGDPQHLKETASAPRTLIDELIAEQQSLTAIERFARSHELHDFPAQARYYRDLVPLNKPTTGEQYAFAVDLDACTGCKACVSACHSLNGLDEGETWRDIGLLQGGSAEEPWQQTVTTACHHCLEPACLEGCPVRAYEKDDETGIVRHLDDQCIGCQYCVLKCPYDVPKYSKARGIVRKCDMCHSRLAVGEAPACVQACPSGAITIRVVEKRALLSELVPDEKMLPDAFDSSYTQPTTAYNTTRGVPANARAGSTGPVRAEHAHWPLIWMLVLTQMAAGLLVGAAGLGFLNHRAFGIAEAPLAITAFLLLNVGLAVSILHLGRPLGAWRAFLGLGTSWMSREIFAFSFFAAGAAAFTAASLWRVLAAWIPLLSGMEWIGLSQPFLAAASASLGLLGVLCSAMIYVDTRRPCWSFPLTFTRFFGSTFLLGSGGCAAVLERCGLWGAALVFMISALLLRVALFAWEFRQFNRALGDEASSNHRSALILSTLLRPHLRGYWVLFLGSMVFSLAALLGAGPWSAATFLLLTFISQILERYFFFAAGGAPRMPGVSGPSLAHHL